MELNGKTVISTDDLKRQVEIVAARHGVNTEIALAACVRQCVKKNVKVLRPDELAAATAKNKLAGDAEDTVLRDPRKLAA